ncbi:MAG: DUF420 domain-containing protein [Planctomycetota bacterium]
MPLLAMGFEDLPTLNATLNATSTVLLVAGWWHIRKGNRETHRKFMLAAVTTSVLFLISYGIYHSSGLVTRFPGTGMARVVYLSILLTHTVLAAAVPFMVAVTLVRALRERFDAHRKIARWTMPVWLYVSFTGVVIYWMLYRMEWA